MLTTRQRERKKVEFFFLLPAFALYSVFVLYPAFQSLYVSFFRWRGFSPMMDAYVGLTNYIRLFISSDSLNAIRHNVILLVFFGVITLSMALFFAQALSFGIKGESLFRITFFFPNIMSMVIVGILWGFIYDPSFGLLNAFLRSIGLGKLCRAWLGDPGIVLYSIGFAKIWMSVGFYMILFLVTITNIPKQLYEAAELDGATHWHQFWYITIPLIWGVFQITIVFIIMSGIQIFALVWTLTEGGPNGASEVLATFMYKNAFFYDKLGFACAVAFFSLMIVFIGGLFVFRIMRKEVVEY